MNGSSIKGAKWWYFGWRFAKRSTPKSDYAQTHAAIIYFHLYKQCALRSVAWGSMRVVSKRVAIGVGLVMHPVADVAVEPSPLELANIGILDILA